MLFNKKSQIWYFDFIMGVTMFTLILIVAFRFVTTDLYIPGKETSVILTEARRVSETLLTPGIPGNWSEDTVFIPGIIDEGNVLNLTKLEKLINMTNKSSNKVKQLFGIKSDFLVYFEDKEGNILGGFDNFGVTEESLTDNLVAYFRLDNNDFSDEASIPSDNTGTNSGTANFVNGGILGDARFYNSGGGDYISLANADDFEFGTGDFTFSTWFNTTTTGTSQHIFKMGYSGTNPYMTFRIDADNDIRWILSYDAGNYCHLETEDNTSYMDGQWHHIVAVRVGTGSGCSDTDFDIYMDGEKKVLTEFASSGTNYNLNNIDTFWLGNNPGNTAQHIVGHLDEVGIWNKVLDETERDRLYNSGNGLTYPFTSTQNLSSINDVKAANPEKLITLTRYVVYKHDSISEIVAMKVVLWQE